MSKYKKKEPLEIKKVCSFCEKEFIAKGAGRFRQIFCSAECNNQSWYLKNKKIIINECIICRNNFEANRSNQKYCSDQCSNKASYIRHKKQIKETSRKNLLKREYGLSVKQFERLKKTHNELCWICGKNNKSRNLCVDHDHKTKKIRGLLCDNCNITLGLVNDNSFILFKMILYLKKEPIKIKQNINEIIKEIGISTDFLQRFDINNEIFTIGV